MKRPLLSPWVSRASLGALCCLLAPAFAAEDKPAPRDAAEVVQEGDVARWLEHYQRERGTDWGKQQAQPAPPAPASRTAPIAAPSK